jgi:hypothetical protein
MENLAAGATGGLSDDVQMTPSAACPGGTTIQVRLDVSSGEDHWLSAFELVTSGPRLAISEIQPRNLEPRSQGGLTVILTNEGDGASSALNATLTSATRGWRLSTANASMRLWLPGRNESRQR